MKSLPMVAVLRRILVTAILLIGYCGNGYSIESFNLGATYRFNRDDIPDIDTSHIIAVYAKAREEDDMSLIEISLSKQEQIVMPIIIGFAFQSNVKESILEDVIGFLSVKEGVSRIEEGISYIENLNIRPLLYINTKDMGMIPVKFYLANAYEKALKFEAADSTYIDIVKDIRQDFGPDSEEFVFWTNQAAAGISHQFKNYSKALEVMAPALEAALYSDRVSSSTAFDFLLSYAQKNQRAGRHKQAVRYAAEALSRAESRTEMFKANRLSGELATAAGNYEKAIDYLNAAGLNSPSLADYLATAYNFAELMRITGYQNDAVAFLDELSKYLDELELTEEDKFYYYENLGVAATFVDAEKSASAFREAEKYIDYVGKDELIRHIINSQIYPQDDNSFMLISALDRVELCYNYFVKDAPRLLTEILYLMGHYNLKIRDYKKAQEFLVGAYSNAFEYSDSDPFTDRIHRDLIRMYKEQGYDELWGVTVEAMLRHTSMLEENSYRRLNAISAALDYELTTGNLQHAEDLLNEYRVYRPDDFDTHCFQIRLAIKNGDYNNAKDLLTQLDSHEQSYTTSTNALWTELYKQMKHPDVAVYARRLFEEYRSELLAQLLFMNSWERRNLNDELIRRRDEAIDLIAVTPDMAEVAMDYSLLIKGLLFKTQNSISGYLSEKAEARRDYDIIKNLRKELNRAEIQGNDSLCRQLRGEIGSRERYIISDFVDSGRFKKEFLINSTSGLKDSIQSGTTYVDLVKFNKDHKSYYGAFILNGNSKEISFIPIGHSFKVTDMPAYVWHTLDSLLAGSTDVYFCPDAELAETPLEYTRDRDKIPYSRRYRLHRVFSLCDIRPSVGIGDKVGIIGISDYNSPIGEGESLDRGSWTDLPNVKYEIQLIEQALGSHKPKILFNDDGTETAVKEWSDSNLTTLHISAHGFYRDSEMLNTAVQGPTNNDHNMALRILSSGKEQISGIVLRRGNLSWNAEHIADDEDDLLTAEEIELLNFPELRLTVLSACDTGLGEIDGEGVWGLQRAFRIAGSRNIICTLTKVDDYWTAQFMAVFYEQAAQGKTIYDSFHAAQQWLCKELPDNPEIWSSFILIE
ncbi:MAG: CHAT domain-containing protein [Muribaculaceae bacterium]|nr:CHAT domain-containing protein [Muribaculaceae bacterium]